MLVGFRVLPIIPVVHEKTALPRLGHAHIVLLAQARGEGGRLAARSAVPAGSRPLTVNITPATVTNTGPDHSGSHAKERLRRMRKVAITLIGALLAFTAGTASASAAPINVDANPREDAQPGITVTVVAVVGETQVLESITTGLGSGEGDKNAGLCASGLIHTSCTPADEASER